MTRTVHTRERFWSKGACVQYVKDLLNPEDAAYILTITIEPLPSGEFFVSVVTQHYAAI